MVAMDGENRQPNVQDLKTLISADLNENLSKVLKIAIISVTFTACFHERDFLKDDHVNPLIHSDPHQLIKTVKAVSPLPLLSLVVGHACHCAEHLAVRQAPRPSPLLRPWPSCSWSLLKTYD